MKRFLLILISALLFSTGVSAEGFSEMKEKAVQALTERLNAPREVFWVYREGGSSENHLTQKALIQSPDYPAKADDLDEGCPISPHSGKDCIKAHFSIMEGGWAGWMFMVGRLAEGETDPELNQGDAWESGYDLSGAECLRFWARGEKGGETLDFFAFGFGRADDIILEPNADSSPTQSLFDVELTQEWQCFEIPLDGLDLSNVVCGFGFALSDQNRNATIYLDDIGFFGTIDALQNALVLMPSYDTDQPELKNTAFSYDNALCALAFLSEGKTTEAARILDAFVEAVRHDRWQSGIVRNAYLAGVITAIPGWGTAAALPGWYDAAQKRWLEDAYQVGSNVGNMSFVALALLQYDALIPTPAYRETAKLLMDWVLQNCRDGGDGFTAGFDGWPEADPPQQTKYTYKSIEHNIDAYAVLKRLSALYGDARYEEAAQSALRLIDSLYDEERQCFLCGTGNDGKTPNPTPLCLDAQVWCRLSLGDAFLPYQPALTQLSGLKTADGGYAFSDADTESLWCEGTAFTALLYRVIGEDALAEETLSVLAKHQLSGGLLPASTGSHWTGLYLSDGSRWEYGTQAHIAPTAWMIMAVNGFNPYCFQ